MSNARINNSVRSNSNAAKDDKDIINPTLTDIEKENIILVSKYRTERTKTPGLCNFGDHSKTFDKNKSL